MPEYLAKLRQRGAVVKVWVRAPGSASCHGPFPAYLDTGASVTVVEPGALHAVGVEAFAEAGLHVLGRAEVSHHGVYQIEIALAESQSLRWISLEVLEGPINPKGTSAALGRDFLAHFVLNYDGIAAKFSLRW